MPSSRTRLVVKTAIYTLLAAGAIGAAAGFTVLRAGWYNVGATQQHFEPVYRLLEQAMRFSVRRHARGIVTPALGAPQQVLRGATVYHANCARCHGAPGFAQDPYGMSLQPMPGPLMDASLRWKPHELYWITRHGIKMSGMPAWEMHLSEADTWAVVAFLDKLPGMSARDYRALTAAPAMPPPITTPAAGAPAGKEAP